MTGIPCQIKKQIRENAHMKRKIYLYLLLGCTPSLLQASVLVDGKSCKPQEHCLVAQTAIQCMDFARADPSVVVKSKYAQCKSVVTGKDGWSQEDGALFVAWVARNPALADEWRDFTRKFQGSKKPVKQLNIDRSAEPGKALRPSSAPPSGPSTRPPGKLDTSRQDALKGLFGGSSGPSPQPKPGPKPSPKPGFGGGSPKATFKSPTAGIDAGFSADGYLYAHKDLLLALPSTAPDVRKKFALDHYEGHGKTESRTFATLPPNFSPEEYLAIHQDVAKAAPDDPKGRFVFAISHFLHSGTEEGRHYHDLPPGFSAERYLSLHPDVAALAPADPSRRVEFAMWHYLHHGKNEGRTHDGSVPSSSGASSSGGASSRGGVSASPATPPGFDAETYLSLNPDLAAAAPAGAQERQAFAEWHYLNHGVNEGRKYSNIPPAPSFVPPTPPPLPVKPSAPSTSSQPDRQGLFGDINKGGFQLKTAKTNDRSGPNLGKGGK